MSDWGVGGFVTAQARKSVGKQNEVILKPSERFSCAKPMDLETLAFLQTLTGRFWKSTLFSCQPMSVGKRVTHSLAF